MAIATVNPATGETLKTFDALTPAQIDIQLARAVTGFAELRATSFAQRAQWMNVAADLLDRERDEVAALMTTEMGKTYASAKADASSSTPCRAAIVSRCVRS